MKRRFSAIAGVVAVACVLWLGPAGAQPTSIAEDMAAAMMSYADEQAKETIKEQSRTAITALYKKIYRSGADKRLVRTLGVVALSAEEINTLAENAAKAVLRGDPESVKAASAQVAIALGQTLSQGLSDPALRKQMASLLGGVDKVNEIADVLGQSAGGDPQAAYEFAGRALISLTPAAAVFTAAEAAVGTMKYLKGKFVDHTIEDLYRKYAVGDEQTRADIRLQLESAGLYSYIVRDHRLDLAKERADAISRATAEPGERVLERLTAASESEVIDNILQTFAARATQERAAAIAEQVRKQAEAEAATMIDALNVQASGKYGLDWWSKRHFNLGRFTQIVRERLQQDGVLDPSDLQHIRAMAQLLSTRLVHGADSKEYRKQLEGFLEFRRVLQGDAGAPAAETEPTPMLTKPQPPAPTPCQPGSAARREADRLWALADPRTKNPAMFKTALAALRQSLALCQDPARLARQKALTDAWVMVAVRASAERVKSSMPSISDTVKKFKDVRQP